MSPTDDTSQYAEPHIKGAIIRPAKEWIIKTYGRPLYNRALAPLSAEHAAVIEGEILSVGWYPLEAWSRFMQSVRREVKAATGRMPLLLLAKYFPGGAADPDQGLSVGLRSVRTSTVVDKAARP